MKKSIVYTVVFLITIPLISMISRSKTTPSENTQETNSNVLNQYSARELLDDNPNSPIANYVVEIFEDSHGNLWFGTMSKGAIRYDGVTLKYFTTEDGLCGNTVTSIKQDREENIWFGTHNGASKYDGKKFTNYRREEGLHGMGCVFLIDSKGTIWAGTNHGVFQFDGTAFQEFELPSPTIKNPGYKWEPGKIWSITEDKDGNLWFGRDGLGACKYDGENFVHFTKEDGLCSNNVSCILQDSKGNIWFGSLSSDFPEYKNEGGLSRYNGESFTTFPNKTGLVKTDIYTIAKVPSGDIWIGATGYGVYRYDGKSFEVITETNRMDLTWSFGLQSLLQDRNGNIWMGFSGGLFRLKNNAIEHVSKGKLNGVMEKFKGQNSVFMNC